MEQSFDNHDIEYGYAKKMVEQYNHKLGNLNIDHTDSNGVFHNGDGINCPECMNRGNMMVISVDKAGMPYTSIKICDKCSVQRANVNRLRKSGLEKLAKRYTFDNFSLDDEWQKMFLEIMRDYADSGFKDNRWLYVGGQSGVGKSHLCTAVTISLMKENEARYIVWPVEARQIKALAMDAERYEEAISQLQNVKLLYIDDFFKPVFNNNGFDVSTSKADVTLAYNILNYRYNNELPTIISSELFSSEIERIDEAIFGRIVESCGKYLVDISRDKKKNHRTKSVML